MSEIRLYEELREASDDDKRYRILARAIEDKRVDLSSLATKQELLALENRIKDSISNTVTKGVGWITFLMTAYKFLEYLKQ